MASIVPRECDLVIVGKTGTGKSSVGNSLLGHTGPGEKPFESKKAAASVTVHCSRKRGNLKDGTLLTIVDTPGLFDTVKPNEETIKEIIKCISLCAPGPHAILFILSLNRFTTEEMDTIKMLKELFGTKAMKHVIVVFTGKDGLDEEDDDVDDFVKSSPYLQKLLEECDSRYVGISNTLSSPTHESDVKDVMKLIYKTMEQNGNKVYSQEVFSKAEGIVKEEIEIRKQEEGKIESRKQREKVFERQEEEFESRELEEEIRRKTLVEEEIQRRIHEEEDIERRKQREKEIERRKQEEEEEEFESRELEEEIQRKTLVEEEIQRRIQEEEDIERRKQKKIEFERKKQMFEENIEKMRVETLEKEELEKRRRLRSEIAEVYRRKLSIEEEEMQRRKQRSEEEETEWKRLQETRIREEIKKDIESNDDSTLSKLSRGLKQVINGFFGI